MQRMFSNIDIDFHNCHSLFAFIQEAINLKITTKNEKYLSFITYKGGGELNKMTSQLVTRSFPSRGSSLTDAPKWLNKLREGSTEGERSNIKMCSM